MATKHYIIYQSDKIKNKSILSYDKYNNINDLTHSLFKISIIDLNYKVTPMLGKTFDQDIMEHCIHDIFKYSSPF